MTQAMINSIALMLLSAALGVVVTAFWKAREATAAKAKALADENAKLTARVTEVESKLRLVDQAVVPISEAFKAILIKELTHFHTPEMDKLMAKDRLTPEEEARLAVLLKERSENMGDDIPQSERDAAAILPAVIRRAKAASEAIGKADQVKWGYVTVTNRRRGGDALVSPDAPPDARQGDSQMAPVAAVGHRLESIDKNTAATAESLAVLNKRAVDKLSTTTATKALKAEKDLEGDA